jgi:hypothetical protein
METPSAAAVRRGNGEPAHDTEEHLITECGALFRALLPHLFQKLVGAFLGL